MKKMVAYPQSLRKVGYRSYIFGDFDKDGIPNADDKKPFDPNIAEPVQEVMLTDELRKICKYNLSYLPMARTTAKEMGGKYRIKGTHSTISKLRRYYLEKHKIEDIGGVKVVSKNYSGVKNRINEARKRYRIKQNSFDDFYAHPKGGYYMAQHITIIKKGKPIEIQSKTTRQNTFHLRVHPLYKTYEKSTRKQFVKLKSEAFKLRRLDML